MVPQQGSQQMPHLLELEQLLSNKNKKMGPTGLYIMLPGSSAKYKRDILPIWKEKL